jgi:hypothetical protein
VASDDGTDLFAQYVVYKDGEPPKVLLVNTDYYSGEGSRPAAEYTLTELVASKASALRMTAPSSDTMTTVGQADPSLEPKIGGEPLVRPSLAPGSLSPPLLPLPARSQCR